MPMITAKVTTETRFELSIEAAAQWFAALNDDQQAQFFVEAAKIMRAWTDGTMEFQAFAIGSHLKNCKCSTEEARDLVRTIYHGLETGVH